LLDLSLLPFPLNTPSPPHSYTLSLHDALPISNAVEYGVPDPSRWPPSLRVFAPGPGTAEALAAIGLTGVQIPVTTFDSEGLLALDRKSTRLNSSHLGISYAVFCLKKKKN